MGGGSRPKLAKPRSSGALPAFGLYLSWRPPGHVDGDSKWIRWPDFGTPTDRDSAIDVLHDASTRALTDRVEIACNGGTGRTGTAIAILAVFAGVPPDDAVAWVRTNYHRRAVETPWQRRWVTSIGTSR